MTTAFLTMIDALFADTNIAQDVTYKVGGTGAGTTLRGIYKRPQKDVGLGMLGAMRPVPSLDLRTSEIATIGATDTVIVNGTEYRIVEPVLDDNGLVWTVSLDNL